MTGEQRNIPTSRRLRHDMESGPPGDDQRQDAKSSSLRSHLLLVIAAAALFWLLREAYAVLMPAVTALLLALGVWPLVSAIRDRVPRRLAWLGPLAGSFLVLAILIAFFAGVGFAARSVYRLARDIGPQLAARLERLPFALPNLAGGGSGPQQEGMATGGRFASGALTVLDVTASTLGGIVLILFLMLLMLTEAPSFNAKLRSISRGRRNEQIWREVGRSVGTKFRAYFVTRLLLGALTGLLYAGLLLVFGVEYVLLWGLLTILLNFIPTVGSIISGTLPTIYVFVTRDPGTALIVGAGLLVIEQVIGNFVDPKIMGRRLAISPLAVLLALVLWTLLWGVAGALLAVPLTVLVTAVMVHFDRYKPAALLLTDCKDLQELEEYGRPD